MVVVGTILIAINHGGALIRGDLDGEHVLQIAGTKDRPDPGTHLGTITSCPACKIGFDLVPNERVNG